MLRVYIIIIGYYYSREATRGIVVIAQTMRAIRSSINYFQLVCARNARIAMIMENVLFCFCVFCVCCVGGNLQWGSVNQQKKNEQKQSVKITLRDDSLYFAHYGGAHA